MAVKDQKALRNFLANKYSKRDYLDVINQFESDEEFEGVKVELFDNWESVDGSLLTDEKFQRLHSNLLQQIHTQRANEKNGYVRRLVRSINKIAALLIIPLLISTFYFFVQWRELDGGKRVYAEIHCPPGTRAKFNLPDGTSGWLNSDSHLKYPIQFLNNRNVVLTGEAYFDVKKDKHHPFVVNAQDMDITVLGTHFNVMAYPDLERIEVSLEEGSVNVTKEGSDLNETLKPDQRLVHDKSKGKASIISGDTGYYTSWKDGFLVFRNVPLSEVVCRLSRWYNSEITIKDDILKDIPYRATFDNETLERVLSLLSMTAPIRYQIFDSKTNEDGTYYKQKVIIYYQK